MEVAIVGAGNMGRGIGTRAVAGGHQVELTALDPDHAQKLASELGPSATALEPGAPFGESWSSSPSTTPVSRTPSASTPTSSPARSWSTSPTRSTPGPGRRRGRRPAARRPDRRRRRRRQAEGRQLVSDGGVRPLDVGPLRRAQQLEQLGFLHIALQQPLDLGFASAIKLHP